MTANSYNYQFPKTKEREVLSIYGQVLIGAAGAVTSYQGVGVTSVVKDTGDGDYLITLDDKYDTLLHASFMSSDDADTAIGIFQLQDSWADIQTAIKAGTAIPFTCKSDGTTAANPADGEAISFRLDVRRTPTTPSTRVQ